MRELRIVVADDHEIVRHGLRALIERQPRWRVCGEAGDGREAVELVKKLDPDLVLLDVSMPGMDGFDALGILRKERPDTPVLILTMHDSDELTRRSVRGGATGVIYKSDGENELVDAIETVSRHEPFFRGVPERIESCLDEPKAPYPEAKSPPERRLTSREQDVVRLLSEGRTNREIGELLRISVKTAENHRANAMRKLDARTVSELVRYAIRNRLIEP